MMHSLESANVNATHKQQNVLIIVIDMAIVDFDNRLHNLKMAPCLQLEIPGDKAAASASTPAIMQII